MNNPSFDNDLPQFGIVMFDNPEEPKHGWASLAGGAVVRIRGLGDLASDAVWVSNLDFYAIKNTGLWSNPKIKRNDFLRIEIARIAKEMGLVITNHNTNHLPIMSEIIDRIMRLGHQYYVFTEIKDSLKSTVNECLFTSLMDINGNGNPSIDQYMAEAFMPFQRCYGPMSTDAQIAQFRFSRVFYANTIVERPVPYGNWSLLKNFPRKSLAKQRKNGPVYKFLSEYGSEKPLLCEVSVTNIDPEYAELLDFGNGTARRNWLPGHEAAFLAAYGDVELKRVIEAEGYYSLTEYDPLVPPSEGVPGELSFSLGVLAENHWLALASPRSIEIHGVKKANTSARATWLRAWDRMICLKAALQFKDAGYTVSSYGIGSVNVSLTPNSFSKSIDFATNLGMSSPFWLLSADNITMESADAEMVCKNSLAVNNLGEY